MTFSPFASSRKANLDTHSLWAGLYDEYERYTVLDRSAPAVRRRRMQELQRMTPAQRRRAQGPTYRRLITVTTQVVANARAVAEAAAAAPRKDEFAECRIAQL